MSREPIATWFFALVVVRLGQRFLLVKERRDGTWYLPAGRVEPGETLTQAARRETLEEAGIPVEIEGVVRFEHTPRQDGSSRVRVVFLARPVDDTEPKTRPDEHSEGAAWLGLDELAGLPLRGPDVLPVLKHILDGGFVAPLSILAGERVT